MPSLSSSPWILGAPRSGFSKLILRTKSRTSLPMSLSYTLSRWRKAANRVTLRLMANLPTLICGIVTSIYRSRVALEAENVTLRHQLNVLRRKAPKRFGFNNFDRFVFTCLYRIAPDVLNALVIVKPDGYPLAPGRVSP